MGLLICARLYSCARVWVQLCILGHQKTNRVGAAESSSGLMTSDHTIYVLYS